MLLNADKVRIIVIPSEGLLPIATVSAVELATGDPSSRAGVWLFQQNSSNFVPFWAMLSEISASPFMLGLFLTYLTSIGEI